VRTTVVVSVKPPPVPVIVIVWFPALAFLPTLTVIVEVPAPGAAMVLGLKLTASDCPSPVAVRVIAALKPPEILVVIVEVPELPGATVIAVGDALIVKLGVKIPVRLLIRPDPFGLPQPVAKS
jgi:hypothetical protein